MDSGISGISGSNGLMGIAFKVAIVAILIGSIVKFMNTTPVYQRPYEGFYGGIAKGSGTPDCLRTLPEASRLLEMLLGRVNMTPRLMDARSDYAELELILSKMACLKKDLMSPSGQVDATRFLAFETAHDRISVAELAGLCMSQNIPLRDLDISFGTWYDRGLLLLRKLCTEAQLSESEVINAEKLFKKCYDEVYNIAHSRCIKTDFIQHGPSDVAPTEPLKNKNLRTYDYTYGGLSASGWNGAN